LTPKSSSAAPLIACIGAANIDRKLRASQALHMGSSNPAQTSESFGGVARNVAENLARLGLPVHLLTAVGQDAVGAALLAQAQQLGIDTQGSLRVAGISTGHYSAVLDANGNLVLAMADMALAERLTPAWLARSGAHLECSKLWLADLNLPPATLRRLQKLALKDGTPLVLVAVSAPKMARLGTDLRGVHTLVLNRAELESYLGHPLPLQRDVNAAFQTLHTRGLQRLVLSLGARGLLFADAAQGHTRMQRLPALPLARGALVDVNGAGDALCAGVCAGLLKEPTNLHTACELGQKLAHLTLQSAQTVSPKISPKFVSTHPQRPDLVQPKRNIALGRP
jgi:pseudouridine kinase